MRQILGTKRHILSAVFICSLFCFTTSCVKDKLPEIDTHSGGVKLNLNILGNTDVATRTPELVVAEHKIHRGYIFVFDAGTGIHVAHEDINIQDHVFDNGTSSPKIYSKILSLVTEGQSIALILNFASSIIVNPLEVTYANINEKFPLYNVASPGFEITAIPESLVGGLPMYGEMLNWNESNITANGYNISVKRSVAKLELQFPNGAQTVVDFGHRFIGEYQIFNHAVRGKFKEGDANTPTYSDKNRAPQSDPITTEMISRNINAFYAEEGGDISQDRISYIYEFPYSTKTIGLNSSSTANTPNNATPHKDRLAIIIRDRGVSGTIGVSDFYRLDLCHMKPEYIDVKRNHHYRIVVNNIEREGAYASAEEALNGPPSNIHYEIEDNIGNTTIGNNRYAISIGDVSETNMIYATSSTTVEVATNVRFILPDGVTNLPSDVTTNKIELLGTNSSGIDVSSLGVYIESETLTKDLQNIKIRLPNLPGATSFPFLVVAETYRVRFGITLGTLEYLSDEIVINQTPTLFDSHPGEITIPHNGSDIKWDTDGDRNHFSISNNGTVDFKVSAGSNVNIAKWKTWNYATQKYDFTDNEKDKIYSIPIFEPKFLKGVSTSTNTRFVIEQIPPRYIGRYGSPLYDSGLDHAQVVSGSSTFNTPLRKRAIMEVFDDVPLVTGWHNSNFYSLGIGEENDGLAISESRASNISAHPPLNRCWQKNTGGEAQKWHLPASQQLFGALLSTNSFAEVVRVIHMGHATNVNNTTFTGFPLVIYWDGGSAGNHGDDSYSVLCIRDL